MSQNITDQSQTPIEEPTNVTLFGKMSEAIDALNGAQEHLVDAAKDVAKHTTDPNAHGAATQTNIAKMMPKPIFEDGMFTFKDVDGNPIFDPVNLKGDTGDKGDMPDHQWNGTSLQMQKPDGTWGEPQDLKGPKGTDGAPGASGQAPEHEWIGTSLRFKNPDGTWGAPQDLKGENGIQEGGGLDTDADGNVYVDFGSMPTDKFEKMLKSIRVPIWLSAPLNIYVNQQTGSDTLDDGRGLSASKPFQTLHAALLYVSTTYNLYIYNVTVHIAQGYNQTTGSITLPSYTTTLGTIVISGPDQNHPEYVKIPTVKLRDSSTFLLKDLTVVPESITGSQHGVYATSGEISLQNVVVDITNTTTSASLYTIASDTSGAIKILATDSMSVKNGVTIKVSSSTSANNVYLLYVGTGGRMSIATDISILGSCTVNSVAFATNAGAISFTLSSLANPGRSPVVTGSGTITGKKYTATMNGLINTRNGGPDFFPGTVAGTTGTGGQYS